MRARTKRRMWTISICIVLIIHAFFSFVSALEDEELFNETIEEVLDLEDEELREGEENEVIINESVESIVDITIIENNTLGTIALFSEILLPNEQVVYTFDDFAEAITMDNGITKIYLGADIIMTKNLNVHDSKSELHIDGTWQGEQHTLTEYNSSSSTGNIYINNNNIKSVTISNIRIEGRNYYGIVRVADAYHDVVITYDSLYYHGPQITFNIYGTAIYKDCIIIIEKTGVTDANEVAEVRNVEFQGDVTINHKPTSHAVFYFYTTTSTLTFAENANVSITTTSSGSAIFYGSSLDTVFEKNAICDIYANRKINNDNNYFTSLYLCSGSAFNIYLLKGNSLFQPIRVNGQVHIEKDATLMVESETTIDSYLFYTGTTTNRLWQIDGNLIISVFNTRGLLSASSLTLNTGNIDIEIFGTVEIVFDIPIITQNGGNVNITTHGTISTYMINTTTYMGNDGEMSIVSNGNIPSATIMLNTTNIILEKAKISIEANGTHGRGIVTQNLTIDEEASLQYYVQTTTSPLLDISGTTGAWNINGGELVLNAQNVTGEYLVNSSRPLLVSDQSIVDLQAKVGLSLALVNFKNSQGYVSITNPKRALFYSSSKNLFRYNSQNIMKLQSQQINYWNYPAIRGEESFDLPVYTWQKDDFETKYLIEGIVLAGNNGNLSSITSNYVEDDGSSGDPKDLLALPQARVLSLGELPLFVDTIYENDTEVIGNTIPEAYIQMDKANNTHTAHAERSGRFKISCPICEVGEIITVTASDGGFLYTTKIKVVQEDDFLNKELSFTYIPETLVFQTTNIGSTSQLVPRLESNWSIFVNDSRITKTPWKIYAQLEAELMSPKDTLHHGLRFIDEDNEEHILYVNQPRLVYSNNTLEEETVVSWVPHQGIQVRMNPSVLINQEYQANIIWILQDTP